MAEDKNEKLMSFLKKLEAEPEFYTEFEKAWLKKETDHLEKLVKDLEKPTKEAFLTRDITTIKNHLIAVLGGGKQGTVSVLVVIFIAPHRDAFEKQK